MSRSYIFFEVDPVLDPLASEADPLALTEEVIVFSTIVEEVGYGMMFHRFRARLAAIATIGEAPILVGSVIEVLLLTDFLAEHGDVTQRHQLSHLASVSPMLGEDLAVVLRITIVVAVDAGNGTIFISEADA